MSEIAAGPKTAGVAFRVSILGGEQVEAYRNVRVVLDGVHGMAHVYGPDEGVQFLSVPLARVLIEWEDPASLQPELRIPPFGPGAFERMGEQLQRVVQGMQHGLGRE